MSESDVLARTIWTIGADVLDLAKLNSPFLAQLTATACQDADHDAPRDDGNDSVRRRDLRGWEGEPEIPRSQCAPVAAFAGELAGPA